MTNFVFEKEITDIMDIVDLKPRKGNDTYRIGDNDDFVVMENIASLPPGKVCLEDHGIILICTEGRAQFEYDGATVQFQKDDLFLYMRNSTACNFMASSNFNCRQIWFTRSELWNINLYARTSLADLSYLKEHPVVHLTPDDLSLLDDYFQLLCRRLKDQTPVLYTDISRALISTMMLEILAILRRGEVRMAAWIFRMIRPRASIRDGWSTSLFIWWSRATGGFARWMNLQASSTSHLNISQPFSRKQ